MENEKLKKEEIGITYVCKECGKEQSFKRTPNADTNKHEGLAHKIYSIQANKGYCGECMRGETAKKLKKKEMNEKNGK